MRLLSMPASMPAKGRGRRFSTELVEYIAARCRFGYPQVLVCAPMRATGPFPTTFWLACPYLVREAGRWESGWAIRDLEAALAAVEVEWFSYHKLHVQLRLQLLFPARRKYLRLYRTSRYRALLAGGVGGIAYARGEVFAKCIHLQIASLLALGFHPAESCLRDELGEYSCADADCARLLKEWRNPL